VNYIYKFCILNKFYYINNKILISKIKNLIVFDIDICGPIKLLGLNKECYFIIIINKNSHTVWVYNIKNKNNIYIILLDFFKLINI